MTLPAQLATAAVILAGLYLLTAKRRAGWLVMFCAGFAYLYAYWSAELYVFMGVQLVFMVMNVVGFKRWGRST